MHDSTIRRLCSWSGIATALTFFGGFVIAGFFPPPGPAMTAVDVDALFESRRLPILLGMMVWMLSGMFMCFFIGVLAEYLRKIPGAPPALSYAQIAAGALNVVFFVVPPALLIVAAFRPGRSAELTYLLYDLGWIMAILPWPGATAQSAAIGLAILSDTGSRPVFPRWMGWYNLYCALGYITGTGLIFVTRGPFAWNSVFPFWFAGTLFFAWFFVMHYGLLRAISNVTPDKQ